MDAENPRQFFDGLEARASGSSKAAGMNATYLFDVDGAGKWMVRVENGQVRVAEGEADADPDTTIQASEDTFMKVVRGEQNPTSAFMTGKLKVRGDMGKAMQLQKLF